MDFKIYEQGDGGELNIIGGDIEPENTLSNSIYLSLFSGDVWYNIFEESDSLKTNDDIENLLKEFVVSTKNLRKLESLINESLNWLMDEGVVESIDTSAAPSFESIKISILIKEPNNADKKYIIIWNRQKQLTNRIVNCPLSIVNY